MPYSLTHPHHIPLNLTISALGDDDDWKTATGLVRQYIASLNLDLSFQNIENELQNITTEYGVPSGCFFIARTSEKAVGCIGLRKHKDGICEMKRLYVMPEIRGQGIGKLLIQRVIEEARKLNYRKMLLDTLPTMTAAQEIYKDLGFTEIPPYRFNPIEGTMYLQLEL